MSAPSALSHSPVATRSPIGSFGPDLFASHLASIASSPAWWLERKRAAWEKFAELPMPRRTDESWRFSNILGLTLDGFLLLPGEKSGVGPLAVKNAASLTFVNNTAMRGAVSER